MVASRASDGRTANMKVIKMSQPCSAVDLVLFDAHALAAPEIRPVIDFLIERGVQRGALCDGADVADLVSRAGYEDELELWLPGSNGHWPFERALALTNVPPQRVLFVSLDPNARANAERHGYLVSDGEPALLERLLL